MPLSKAAQHEEREREEEQEVQSQAEAEEEQKVQAQARECRYRADPCLEGAIVDCLFPSFKKGMRRRWVLISLEEKEEEEGEEAEEADPSLAISCAIFGNPITLCPPPSLFFAHPVCLFSR